MVVSEDKIHELLSLTKDFDKNEDKILSELSSLPSYVEVAEFLDASSLDATVCYRIFMALDLEVASNVFGDLSFDVQKQIYNMSDKITFAKMFTLCPSSYFTIPIN